MKESKSTSLNNLTLLIGLKKEFDTIISKVSNLIEVNRII